MNKKVQLLLCALAGLVVAGCNLSLEQDPMAKQPDAIRNAIPGSQKPGRPEPLRKDVVVADGPDDFTFEEGKEETIQFSVRLLEPNKYEQGLEVENLSEFQGASFDGKTGVFTWAPPKGTVMGVEDRTFTMKLKAWGYSLNEDLPDVYRDDKKVSIRVKRKFSEPEIKSMEGDISDPNWREGNSYSFLVVVKDLDGGSGLNEAPELKLITPTNGSTISLIPYTTVRVKSVDLVKSEWTFEVDVDLDGQNITSSSVMGGFDLRVVNRFNRTSLKDRPFSKRIFLEMTALKTTWVNQVTITPRQDNTIPFFIYDEAGELEIAQTPKNLPAGSNITCASGFNLRPGLLSCEFRWNPPHNTAEQNLNLTVDAVGRNSDVSDKERSRKTFSLPLKVIHLPAPATP